MKPVSGKLVLYPQYQTGILLFTNFDNFLSQHSHPVPSHVTPSHCGVSLELRTLVSELCVAQMEQGC